MQRGSMGAAKRAAGLIGVVVKFTISKFALIPTPKFSEL